MKSSSPFFVGGLIFMRGIMNALLMSALLLGVLFHSQTAMACQVPIDSMQLNESTTLCAGTYTLPYGMRIARDNVHIECLGTLLQGQNANAGIDVSGRTNITIKGCSLEHFDIGINVSQSSQIRILNNSFSSILRLTGPGMGAAILLTHAISSEITGNTANNITLGIGVFDGSQGNLVHDNVFEHGAFGIDLGFLKSHDIPTNNTFVNNTVLDMQDGITTRWESSGNFYYNNTLISNWASDFTVQTNNNIFEGNVGMNGRGFRVNNVNNNTFRNNRFTNNGSGGTPSEFVFSNVADSRIENNSMKTLPPHGHIDGMQISGINNSIIGNVITGSSTGIQLATQASIIRRNNLTQNSVGLEFVASDDSNNISENDIYDNGLNWVNAQPNNVTAINNYWGTIRANIIDNKLHDYADDASLGRVIFCPVLNGPFPDGISSSCITDGAPLTIQNPNSSTLYIQNGTTLLVNLCTEREASCDISLGKTYYHQDFLIFPHWDDDFVISHAINTTSQHISVPIDISYALTGWGEWDSPQLMSLVVNCEDDLGDTSSAIARNFALRSQPLTLDATMTGTPILPRNQSMTLGTMITTTNALTQHRIIITYPNSSQEAYDLLRWPNQSINNRSTFEFNHTQQLGIYQVRFEATDSEANTVTEEWQFEVFEAATITTSAFNATSTLFSSFESSNGTQLDYGIIRENEEGTYCEPAEACWISQHILPVINLTWMISYFDEQRYSIWLYNYTPIDHQQFTIIQKKVPVQSINAPALKVGAQDRFVPIQDGSIFYISNVTDSLTYELGAEPNPFYGNKRYYSFIVPYSISTGNLDYSRARLQPYYSPEIVNSSFSPVMVSETEMITLVEDVGGCGDGVVQGSEACDNGNANGACPAACSVACTINSCSHSGGGGGGGGGGAAAPPTYVVSEDQLERGFTRQLPIGAQFKMHVAGEDHTILLANITSSTATLHISSKAQVATLSLGETRSFDVNQDGTNEISITLNSINNSKAMLTVGTVEQSPSSTTSVTPEPLRPQIARTAKQNETLNGTPLLELGNVPNSNINQTNQITGEAVSADFKGNSLNPWLVCIVSLVGLGIIIGSYYAIKASKKR